MTEQVEVPEGVTSALARVGVEMKSHSLSINNQAIATVLRFPGQGEHVILGANIDPEPANGLQAAVRRRAMLGSAYEDALWVSSPRASQWGAEPGIAITAEVLRYRADAMLWHGLSEYLVDGTNERVLATMVPVTVGPRRLPIPMLLHPSPKNAYLGWSAEVSLPHSLQFTMGGIGLCSSTVLEAALSAKLATMPFDAAPPPEKCASTLHNDQRWGAGWGDHSWDARLVALVLGLCQDCALSFLDSQVPPLPIQPPKWGEKIR